jgi:hypothetical protein
MRSLPTKNKMLKMAISGAFLLLFLAPAGHAQNLQFSRVILVTNATDTVPAGKVWKLESLLPPEIFTFGSNNAPLQYEIFVNGNSRKIGHAAWTDSNQNATTGSVVHLPVWLPGGTTLRAGANVAEISVIEFEVSP